MPGKHGSVGKGLNPGFLAKKDNQHQAEGGKAERRFRFQNFAEQVASVSIDVHHRLTNDDQAEWREREGGDGDTPFAATTMERWVELNLTSHFQEFRKEMSPMLLSVPLILHRREAVFAALRRHLTGAPSIALKPMLEVAAALAIDLRQEFYPEFPALLTCLASYARLSSC